MKLYSLEHNCLPLSWLNSPARFAYSIWQFALHSAAVDQFSAARLIWRIILGRSGIINGMLLYVGLNTIVTSIVLIFIGVRLSGSHRAPVR